MSSPTDLSPDSDTPAGRWTQAVGNGGDSDKSALRELVGTYWYCIYAWWRRAGLDPVTTTTATLACVERWLGDSPPGPEDEGVARMRDWTLAQLHELAGQGVKLKGESPIEVDGEWAEKCYADEPEEEPDDLFQRRWAITVTESAISKLKEEYSARGEQELFDELLEFAGFDQKDEDRYSSIGQKFGQTAGSVRKEVFEFRTRQREILQDLATDTVLEPADTPSEITALLCACSGSEATEAPLPTAIQGLRPDDILMRAMRSVQMTTDGTGNWEPPTIEEAAHLFPQYEISDLIGRGGMGAVYRGRQVELDRAVAIKLLPLEVSVNPEFADRFRREARAMAKLHHPNIISIHDFGTTSEGHLFFVMEFVEGTDLHHMIHGPGVNPTQALSIISGTCDALAYAHGKGVVHRDIKPANIMVSVDGEVKVADFGLARLLEPDAEQIGRTVTGAVMGTPDYMAPEQTRGMDVDHRADIYSLGVMLYEMLCGEVPRGIFDPPSARVQGVDEQIDQVVIRAMQQVPDRRYQSTEEMKTDVSAVKAGGTPKAAKPKISKGKRKPKPKSKLENEGSLFSSKSKRGKLVYSGIAASVAIVGIAFFSGVFGPKAGGSGQGENEATVSVHDPAYWTEAIDLLEVVDLEGDVVSGNWEFEDGNLVSDMSLFARVQIPYLPPEEFDYRATFRYDESNPEGGGQVTQLLSRNGKPFSWIMGAISGAYSAFETIAGETARSSENPTSRKKWPILSKGKVHTSVVQVRTDGIKAFLNGELVAEFETDYSDLDMFPAWKLSDPRLLGFGSYRTAIVVESLDLIEVKGRGRELKERRGPRGGRRNGLAERPRGKPPRPGLETADMSKPVQVFIMMGDMAMLGNGQPNGEDKKGTLEYLTKKEKKYSHLLNERGHWTERRDVRYVRVDPFDKEESGIWVEEWLTVKSGRPVGTEIQIGHRLGETIDAPVLLLKSSTGNRALGWSLLPPGSERFKIGGTTYAGYKDAADKWQGEYQGGGDWYAGKQFDLDVTAMKQVLADMDEHYPGANGYEIAGFFWWQGMKDLRNPVYCDRYELNLVNLIKALRSSFDAPGAPFVLATHGVGGRKMGASGLKIVNAQLSVGDPKKYPEFAGRVKTVDSREHWKEAEESPVKNPQVYNHNAETFMDVGDEMARAMVEILKNQK